MFDLKKIENDTRKMFSERKYNKLEISARLGSHRNHEAVIVSVTQMYDKPSYEGGMLALLQNMAKAMGTKEIDIYSSESSSGCESCDYGSSYGWEFIGWN